MAYEREVDVLTSAVRAAGEAIKRHFVNGARVYTKPDSSPVTDADLAANTILIERLRSAFPGDAILSEEVAPDDAVHDAARCWIIDPLDGTASFVRREPNFAVMVGLEVDGRPVVGAIYNPMTDECYAAVCGEGATVTRGGETISLRFPAVPYDAARLGVTPGSFRTLTTGVPRWTGDPARFTLTGPNFGFRPEVLDKTFDAYVGWIAGGLNAGGYPWDLCASDLIVHEAGGALTDVYGQRHRFRRVQERVQGGLVAARDAALHAAVLGQIAADETK